MSELYDVVMSRKSVRSFDGHPLRAEDREKLTAFIGAMKNPFSIPVTFRILDAQEYGLSSPVLTGDTLYVAGTVGRVPCGEEAFGFAMEALLLYARRLGIGSVWLGGTMKREAFEKAVGLRPEERMPCVSPLGYPAKKRSLRESLMRKGVKADERRPIAELFFDGDFSSPLSADGRIAQIMEMVRWAPSAVNKQPWRILRHDGLWHFYEKQDKGFVNDATGDLQRIDVGIALCHFLLGSEDAGLSPSLVLDDPGLALPPELSYVASVRLGAAGT